MLEDIRRNYVKQADQIKGWQSMNKNDLINACIDHEDDPILYNCYFSAVVLRYWGNIGKYYTTSKASGFTIEECYEWLLDAIMYILKMRKWRDPNNPLSKDKCAPDKCINRCIYSSRQQHYYTSNLDKHKANYGNLNLDELTDQVGDHNELLADSSFNWKDVSMNMDLMRLFKRYFENNNIISSIVLYSLCESDCFKEKIDVTEIEGLKVKKSNYEFKLSKLINSIYEYKEEDIKEMGKNLWLNEDQVSLLNDSYVKLQSITKNKVTTIVKKTIKTLSEDKYLRSYLCY